MTTTFKVVNGDVQISSATGRPIMIEGREKIIQDCRENIDTRAQRDGTGADLSGLVGVVGDVFSLRALLARRVNDSFAALKQIHDKVQRFDRTPEERIARVAEVVVTPLRQPGSAVVSNTDFAFRVDIISAKGERSSITGVLSR